MTERCNNCGAELYAGQQFCRQCGTPVARAQQQDAPTQLFPKGGPNSGPVNSGPFAGTSPLAGGARTDAVGPQTAAAYQPRPSNSGPMPTGFQQAQTPASFQYTSPLVGQPFGSQPLSVGTPARKGRGLKWLVALFAVFVFSVGALGVGGYLWLRAKRQSYAARTNVPNVPNIPKIPEMPSGDIGNKIKQALKEAGLPQPLDESGATVTGTDTVITKTFQLDDDATFSVRGIGGNFTITGTDGEQAEVKVTKHGGSPDERKAVPVLLSQTDEQLSIVGGPASSGVEVSYEIKLPRDLKKIEIRSDHGDLKFADFGGAIDIKLRQGNLEFRDVSGSVHSELVKGDVKLSLDKSEREDGQEFSVVNGNIEATIADGADANLKAETITGEISVDERYGLKVEKHPAGRSVTGQLGDGGPALGLKAVNGDIRLKK
ncbi:MAG TPA: DUF4097 family beta strand repeat-containing protein [Pyrinomonadaceae bacterium]|nr:DUF4097 family beta strand repeat-containing protein [Pyrinomonadaceae bacterium]